MTGREPFVFTGLNSFNAIYNPVFNCSSEDRRRWLEKLQSYAINVLRVWGQWNNRRGVVETDEQATLHQTYGKLRPEPLTRLKTILADAVPWE